MSRSAHFAHFMKMKQKKNKTWARFAIITSRRRVMNDNLNEHVASVGNIHNNIKINYNQREKCASWTYWTATKTIILCDHRRIEWLTERRRLDARVYYFTTLLSPPEVPSNFNVMDGTSQIKKTRGTLTKNKEKRSKERFKMSTF